MSSVKKQQSALLQWFDRHRRVMPWRARKGQRPNPYHVWLSEIMLQQTTVATVGSYFEKFIQRWPTVNALAKADQDQVLAAWAGLGYYARARNLHKCAKAMAENGGKFPSSQDELIELPGIGPYTAAAIASIAFDLPAIAVDGNVERVVSRMFAIEDPLPLSKKEIYFQAEKLGKGVKHPGDFTQAFMELGATVCTPRKPKCAICPWENSCKARRAGNPEDYPRKLAKKKKPQRFGKVFFIQDDAGKFLIRKRVGKGLYEGMYELPTTEWVGNIAAVKALPAPEGLRCKDTGAIVRHSFTHFDLVLEIWVGKSARKHGGQWISSTQITDFAMPTLMKKAVKLAQS